MKLPADILRAFQEACLKDFGRTLNDDEAEEAAMRVLHVVHLVSTILAEKSERENRN